MSCGIEFDIAWAAKSLYRDSDGSKFEPIIGNPGDGASPHCAIVDEYHEHDSSDQVDTMVTGMGARDQPLLLIITTAGVDFGGPCREKRTEVKHILDGTFDADEIFGIIFTVDEDDDWDDIASAQKANPNWDVSINAEFIGRQLEAARRSASKQTAYRTKHLNQWVGAKSAWMNMLALRRCEKPLQLQDFEGQFCVLGLDLASKIDLAALTLLFSDGGTVTQFNKHWLPYETVYGDESPNPRYRDWAEAGLLEVTDGAVTNFDLIEDEIRECMRRFQVHEVAFDPYQATQLASHLLEEGVPMVEVGATVRNFSEPMKELEAMILATARQNIDGPAPSRLFQYAANPVLTWQYGNVVAKVDKKDNTYPDKERGDNKIDGVVSCIMAMSRLIRLDDDQASFDLMLSNPIRG